MCLAAYYFCQTVYLSECFPLFMSSIRPYEGMRRNKEPHRLKQTFSSFRSLTSAFPVLYASCKIGALKWAVLLVIREGGKTWGKRQWRVIVFLTKQLGWLQGIQPHSYVTSTENDSQIRSAVTWHITSPNNLAEKRAREEISPRMSLYIVIMLTLLWRKATVITRYTFGRKNGLQI